MSGHRSGDDAFEAVRPRLHGIAYRMTGSVGDADDLCQEAWIRWSAADRATVRDPEAFLVTVTTRLALDRLRSARHRRETYVGPYLPDDAARAEHQARRVAPGVGSIIHLSPHTTPCSRAHASA